MADLKRTVLYLSRGYRKGKILKLAFLSDVLYHERGEGFGVEWWYGKYGPFSSEVLSMIDHLLQSGALEFSIEIDEDDPHYKYVTRLYARSPPCHRDEVLDYVLERYGGMSYRELVEYTKSLLRGYEYGSTIDPSTVRIGV